MSNKIYFPGLNGLRAVSAIAVVISHITLNLQQFNLNPKILGTLKDGNPAGLMLGEYGVTIFFVLSGFLITFLLQKEKDRYNINIKKFYLRRIFRIWPLYYLYLIIAVIVTVVLNIDLKINSLFFYIFFAPNIPSIIGNRSFLVAHLWSLGAEEQFYLFWPWLNKKIKSLVNLIIALIFILIILKISLHFIYPNTLLEAVINITKFHCMMLGGLGALLYKGNNKFFLKVSNNKLTQIICWIIIFLAAINKFHLASVIDNELISVVALFLIIGQIKIKNRVLNLELPVFYFLGKISYGIYIIHPLLILLFSKLLAKVQLNLPAKYILVYLSIFGTTVLFSWISYISFERFFFKLKDKYAVAMR
jgi:peptidoglycan/LPS O-acetylase OafA/YrhL